MRIDLPVFDDNNRLIEGRTFTIDTGKKAGIYAVIVRDSRPYKELMLPNVHVIDDAPPVRIVGVLDQMSKTATEQILFATHSPFVCRYAERIWAVRRWDLKKSGELFGTDRDIAKFGNVLDAYWLPLFGNHAASYLENQPENFNLIDMTREEIKELVALKCWAVEKTDGDVVEHRITKMDKDGKVLPIWAIYHARLDLQSSGNTLLEAYREFQREYYEAIAPEPRTVTNPRGGFEPCIPTPEQLEQLARWSSNPRSEVNEGKNPYAELLTRVERIEKMLTPHVKRKEVDTSCQINKDYYTK